MQVPDNGGKERPTRPKYDVAEEGVSTKDIAPCDPCGGTTTSTVTSTFVSSVGLGFVSSNPAGYIYSLRIISGDNSAIQPSVGHIKINADLNRGSGGKYIYLTFTRDTTYTYENDGAHPAQTFDIPLTYIRVASYTQFDYNNPYSNIAPGDDLRHMFKFEGGKSYPVDLNDGAGGKYVFGHVSRLAKYGDAVKEVGVIYGNSSSINPPTGWIKVAGDLNENAGGDYIYFCYKR